MSGSSRPEVFGAFLPGKPQSWKRAARRGRSTYKDRDSSHWQSRIRALFEPHFEPSKAPFGVELVAYFQRPLSHHVANDRRRELKPSAPRYHTPKPDADNLEKGVLDALEGVVWVNDSQVAKITTTKLWANEGERLGLQVSIWSLEGQAVAA